MEYTSVNKDERPIHSSGSFAAKAPDGWKTFSNWWFQIFFIFNPTWGDDPIWLIFFRWVGSTTTQFSFPSKDGIFPGAKLVLVRVQCWFQEQDVLISVFLVTHPHSQEHLLSKLCQTSCCFGSQHRGSNPTLGFRDYDSSFWESLLGCPWKW